MSDYKISNKELLQKYQEVNSLKDLLRENIYDFFRRKVLFDEHLIFVEIDNSGKYIHIWDCLLSYNMKHIDLNILYEFCY